jgi:hypothetical protein
MMGDTPMSSEARRIAQRYIYGSVVAIAVPLLVLIVVLMAWIGPFGPFVAAFLLLTPAAMVAYNMIGRRRVAVFVTSLTIVAVWLVLIFAATAWATGAVSAYDGVRGIVLMALWSVISMVAVSAIAGAWFGYGLTLRREAIGSVQQPSNAAN